MSDSSLSFSDPAISHACDGADCFDQHQSRYFQGKYLFDRIAGTILLIVSAPLILCLIALVKLTSRGPGLYRQERVGLNGQRFQIIKLRSMRMDAEKSGKAVWCVKNDSRVTRIGRVLRKLHLDELPQLVNVARGEMSLVGPRPERPEICKDLALQIKDYYRRNVVKSGVTGLAQINLPPDETIYDVRRKQVLDLRYIEEANFWLDARMIIATALRMIGLRGATVTSWMRLCRMHLLASPATKARHNHVSDRLPTKWIKMPRQKGHLQHDKTEARDRSPLSDQVSNAFTVDVEDYFQVSAFSNRVSRSTWDTMECRVERNTDRILSLCDRCDVRGTFFVLGWVADRYPELVRRIADAGHEIASHGYWHQLVYELNPDEFAKDIADSRDAIANACDIVVDTYRAPSFSIVQESLWALDILVDHGFTTDSSIFPISGHDRYGMPSAQQDIHELYTSHGSIREFPPSLWRSGPFQAPIGGGYFRLLPLSLTVKAIREVRAQGRPAMFYMHPWEIDPDQPRIPNAKLKSRFRHCVGLHRTQDRLERLLRMQPFDCMSSVIQSTMPQTSSHELESEMPVASS